MDRSMKVMFGMMTVAIFMLAFTMMGNQSQQAFAGNYVDDRDRIDEPTIVSFRVTTLDKQDGGHNAGAGVVLLTRMWSDGTVEMNVVGNETIPTLYQGNRFIALASADAGSLDPFLEPIPPP